jgi:hypothetical protein
MLVSSRTQKELLSQPAQSFRELLKKTMGFSPCGISAKIGAAS